MKYCNLKSIWCLLLVTILSGCSTFGWQKTPVLAVPEQVSYEDEVKLAQLSQQLYRQDIDDSTRMQLYFQRGVAYDSLGFKAFAQNDFSQVLNYNQAIPDVYNYLGIYSMQEDDLNSAFLAFNTTLELDPDYQFAYINRAISLYRNGRFDLARDDAIKFYEYAPGDPVRSLWLYLIEFNIDKSAAKDRLQERYDAIDDKTVWGSDIIAFYLGQISESRLMINLQQDVDSNKVLAQRLCETYFYLGKYYQSKGDNKRAEMLYKYALSGNVYNYIEHQQALYEIRQLNQ